MSNDQRPVLDFVRQIVTDDLTSGKWQQVVTRFPPEPNGYLHIGHAKSICLNFGIAQEFGGICRLRFDDTNPSKEDQEYVDGIIRDVAWLTGRDDIEVRYASDIFPQMYQWAEQLIEQGDAYVDDQDQETIRQGRGTITSPGKESPCRNRSVAENLQRFRAMRAGTHAEGACVLRAKIDMAHPNMLLRDPLLYRIQHREHHRTGTAWCIYPLYDWAHGLEDSVEGVTHSICTLEFETHRPLYDWFLNKLRIHHPQQIEFNRLNLTYTMMSKRKLLELVQGKWVLGWDDPRMPTLAGLRRRGVTPQALRAFCAAVGVTKVESVNEWALFEHHIRHDLNHRAARTMAVLRPLKLVIENFTELGVDHVSVEINPEQPDLGKRRLELGQELWIEQDDFMLDPPPKFFRLGPGREVRLRGIGYFRCTGHSCGPDGAVIEVRGTVDPATQHGGAPADGRKVKATIHWLAAHAAVPAEIRLYEHLFTQPDPAAVPEGQDWTANLAKDSRQVLTDARIPRELSTAAAGIPVQFERLGYFTADPDSRPARPVFNRTATLRDEWAKR